jgi:hypothetical protein
MSLIRVFIDEDSLAQRFVISNPFECTHRRDVPPERLYRISVLFGYCLIEPYLATLHLAAFGSLTFSL